MTRVNSGINPTKLPNKLLLAELREIIRIPYLVKNRIDKRMEFNDIPIEFTLNSGHVKFFFNKLQYIENRYLSLLNEYRNRDFNWNDTYTVDFLNVIQYCKDKNKRVYNSWTETTKSKSLLIERLLSKANNYKTKMIIRNKEYNKTEFKTLLLSE